MVDKAIDNMYKSGKTPTRNIPARPNEDFDLIAGELLIRFSDLTKEYTVFDALIFYDNDKREKFELNIVSKDVDKLRKTIKIVSGAKEVRLRYEEIDNLQKLIL